MESVFPGVVIKEITTIIDSRGYLTELYRLDEDNYQSAMAYESWTKPGKIRGPHEHTNQTDFFIFPGPGNFVLFLWDNRPELRTFGQQQKLIVGSRNSVKVLIPPGIVHGYKAIGQEKARCLNFPDKLYKKEAIDEIRWEENPGSPFKID